MIFPADAPRVAELSGFDVRLRLESGKSKAAADDEWHTGRAGMQYRDLVPDRLGGRVIASHIRIPDGGPVPDYVHHHGIEFQVIYCRRGWVRVVYEDQGPPFVMKAGDCVLQPPHIRHRVLECSDRMEVVEVGSPAEHETLVEHELELPSSTVNSARDFDGQKFVWHQSAKAVWQQGPYDGFEARDTGIHDATNALASVLVIRSIGRNSSARIVCEAGFVFCFVLQGSLLLQNDEQSPRKLAADDSFVVQTGRTATIGNPSKDLEMLQVTCSQ